MKSVIYNYAYKISRHHINFLTVGMYIINMVEQKGKSMMELFL